MSKLLLLYYEFFKTGLFAIGGGLATLPFLKNMGEKFGWFTYADLMNMLAISESTPGPIGINMATYVGFSQAGVLGAVVATLGEVSPSIIVIVIIGKILEKFKNSKLVKNAFYGLRPAASALVGSACLSVMIAVLSTLKTIKTAGGYVNYFQPTAGEFVLKLPQIALAVGIWIFTNKIKKTKKLHPVVAIAICAVVGIVFKF